MFFNQPPATYVNWLIIVLSTVAFFYLLTKDGRRTTVMQIYPAVVLGSWLVLFVFNCFAAAATQTGFTFQAAGKLFIELLPTVVWVSGIKFSLLYARFKKQLAQD